MTEDDDPKLNFRAVAIAGGILAGALLILLGKRKPTEEETHSDMTGFFGAPSPGQTFAPRPEGYAKDYAPGGEDDQPIYDLSDDDRDPYYESSTSEESRFNPFGTSSESEPGPGPRPGPASSPSSPSTSSFGLSSNTPSTSPASATQPSAPLASSPWTGPKPLFGGSASELNEPFPPLDEKEIGEKPKAETALLSDGTDLF